jgi:hypothetical protein
MTFSTRMTVLYHVVTVSSLSLATLYVVIEHFLFLYELPKWLNGHKLEAIRYGGFDADLQLINYRYWDENTNCRQTKPKWDMTVWKDTFMKWVSKQIFILVHWFSSVSLSELLQILGVHIHDFSNHWCISFLSFFVIYFPYTSVSPSVFAGPLNR